MLHPSSGKVRRMVQNFPGPGKYLIFFVQIIMIKTDVEDGFFTCHWHSLKVNFYADSEDRFFLKIKEFLLLPSAKFPNM